MYIEYVTTDNHHCSATADDWIDYERVDELDIVIVATDGNTNLGFQDSTSGKPISLFISLARFFTDS